MTEQTFRARNLSVLGFAQGFTYWHYRANQPTLAAELIPPVTKADVQRSGFWEGAQQVHLASGDMIMASCLDGGTMLYVMGTQPMDIRVMTQT